MKKYSLIGLAIIIGSNIAALTSVAFNRSGEATAHLILTERELYLPYNFGAQKENSGISLAFNWRTSTKGDKNYSPYSSKNIKITKAELFALGFDKFSKQKNHWAESLELYWAFEFDGPLHKAEIRKATIKYQQALLAAEEHANDKTQAKEKQMSASLIREETSNSRLFFIEAAADFNTLTTKYSGQKNILIVKGVSRPYYNSNDKTYSLSLNNLSVANIMIPLAHADVFSGLSRTARREIQLPRYTVSLKWGTRLEPWVLDAKRLTD